MCLSWCFDAQSFLLRFGVSNLIVYSRSGFCFVSGTIKAAMHSSYEIVSALSL